MTQAREGKVQDDTKQGGPGPRSGAKVTGEGRMKLDQQPAGKDERARPDQHTVDVIGRQLKSTYGKLLSEPVPEHFLKLLEQLDGREEAEVQKDPDEGKDGS